MFKKIAPVTIVLLAFLFGCATYQLDVEEQKTFTVVMKQGDKALFVWSTDEPVEFTNIKNSGTFKATGIIYFEP